MGSRAAATAPKKGDFDFDGHGAAAGDGQVDRHARAPRDRLGELFQERFYLGFDKGVRAQLEQQCAHLRQGAARELAHFLQAPAALADVALPEPRQHLRDQAGRKERLADGIVQVARQAVPFDGGGLLSFALGGHLLALFLGGAIDAHAEDFTQLAVVVEQGAVRPDDPDTLAAALHILVLVMLIFFWVADKSVDHELEVPARRVHRRYDGPHHALTQYIRLLVAEELLGEVVEKGDLAAGIHLQDDGAGVLHQVAELKLALPERFLDQGAPADLALEEAVGFAELRSALGDA